MDFVTITDHDTIAGALAIDHLPDTFLSEELTVWFAGEAQAVHVLCYGITPDDHEWLQAHNDSVENCAAYLQEHEITAALAHPFYAVEAPLTARHRRRLAQLFPIWETRNGSRAKELNLPAFVYIETHGGTAIGGSDDHAGIDIGATFTRDAVGGHAPGVPGHVRAGQAEAHGAQGSAAKWTHAAMALAIRSLGEPERRRRPAQPRGGAADRRARDARRATSAAAQPASDLGPDDAPRAAAVLAGAMDLGIDEATLLELLQEGELSHPDLSRRARRIHERKLAEAVRGVVADPQAGVLDLAPARRRAVRRLHPGDPLRRRRPRSWAVRSSSSPAQTATGPAWRWSPTGSAACTGSPTRSSRSVTAACPATRWR